MTTRERRCGLYRHPVTEQTKAETRRGGAPYGRIAVTYVCVLVMGMCLTWAFLSMRAVAGVGGSCASGGAYEIATPCPDGSWLIALAIPLMLIAMFLGSGVGSTIGAPTTLLPMWALLFTSLGWNFLEFAFKDGFSFSFLFCGIMFWAMALPAWWAMFAAFTNSIRRARDPEKQARTNVKLPVTNVWSAASLEGSLWWWGIFLVLGSGGAFLGVAIYALAAA